MAFRRHAQFGLRLEMNIKRIQPGDQPYLWLVASSSFNTLNTRAPRHAYFIIVPPTLRKTMHLSQAKQAVHNAAINETLSGGKLFINMAFCMIFRNLLLTNICIKYRKQRWGKPCIWAKQSVGARISFGDNLRDIYLPKCWVDLSFNLRVIFDFEVRKSQ